MIRWVKSFLILANWFFSASLLRASRPSNDLFDLRNGFWINLHLDHVIIFFTAGFVTQQELRSNDPNFQPYAYRHGMYKRVQYWGQDESALRKYWQPFLEGKTTRDDALIHLTHAICCE